MPHIWRGRFEYIPYEYTVHTAGVLFGIDHIGRSEEDYGIFSGASFGTFIFSTYESQRKLTRANEG